MIDPESRAFIRWQKKELSHPGVYADVIDEIINSAVVFLRGDPGTIKAKLATKLKKGAIEHGEPIYTANQVRKELEAECIDLIGWTMVRKYNETNPKKSHKQTR